MQWEDFKSGIISYIRQITDKKGEDEVTESGFLEEGKQLKYECRWRQETENRENEQIWDIFKEKGLSD